MDDYIFEKFKWTEEYKTGIYFIDIQHKELFEAIDEFTLAVYNGEGRIKIKKMMDFLEEYIQSHFDEEEDIMLLNDYPDYHNHVKMHKNFISNFFLLQKDFENRGEDTYFAIRLEKEVRDWWENHVLKEDMKYVPFIKIIDGKSE